MRLFVAFACLLSPTAAAQGVGYGNYISGLTSVATTTSPLIEVDRGGTCAPISGLTRGDIDAVQLDPVNKEIWLGSAQGELLRITLDAAFAVASEVRHATLAGRGAITGITFDDNGNPIVTAGGAVLHVPRHSVGEPPITSLFQFATSTGTTVTSCVAKDDVGNLLFGVTGVGQVWRMDKNPDCSFQPAQMVAPIASYTGSVSGDITGLDYCPTDGQIYWTSRDSYGVLSTSGVSTAGGGFGVQASLDYDMRHDDFALVADLVRALDVQILSKQFSITPICTLQTSSRDGINAIDGSDMRTADTVVLPSCQPPPGPRFRLEIGTECPPGQVAGIFLGSPAMGAPFLPVVAGVVDKTGRLSVDFPSLPWPRAAPAGVLTFVSGCFDQASGNTTIGTLVPWPTN
ncbi:MAG: hypothetical protein AAF628_07910 [Planctomycetota bacterium]